MSQHHELGPSQYPAWSECPCFRSSPDESKEANEGTDAHAELAKALTDRDYIPSNFAARWAADWVYQQTEKGILSEKMVHGSYDGVAGIFGTMDVAWVDDNGSPHITDFKTFSDGTIDYMPQLKGYAALSFSEQSYNPDTPVDTPVFLHVLHGRICKAETMESTFRQCIEDTVKLLAKARDPNIEPKLCKWCQFCKHIKECNMTNNAVTTVSENLPAFSSLSTCQKLVVLDAVDKLSKTIREQAKKEARENGGFIEQNGIRYEFKPWGGGSKCRDIGEVAGAMSDKMVVDKKTRKDSVPIEATGINNETLLRTCTLSKSALVEAMMAANPDKPLTQADWERWADQFYDKTEGTPHFVRSK